ncbi:Cation transport regulator chaB [Cronobacter sakazakii 701]|nr:Cation transport regulator chaB [Cronobacter sakazakii 701]
MPYSSRTDLPDNVRNVLPAHAQDIYKEAFNSAWDQYKDEDDRRGDRVGGRDGASRRVGRR